MTGGRLKRVRDYLGDSPFCFTYGDGLSDVNIKSLIDFHQSHNKLATITAVQPPGRYGALELDQTDGVLGFYEKPQGDGGWINGGFFVLSPEVVDRIEGDHTIWEKEPLSLAKDNELRAYKHNGFWQPMDTLRDRRTLEHMWVNNPPLGKTGNDRPFVLEKSKF